MREPREDSETTEILIELFFLKVFPIKLRIITDF